jgi:hypothetical protein
MENLDRQLHVALSAAIWLKGGNTIMNSDAERSAPEPRRATCAPVPLLRRSMRAATLAFIGAICYPCAAQSDVVTYWNEVASSVTTGWRAPTVAHLAMHDA